MSDDRGPCVEPLTPVAVAGLAVLAVAVLVLALRVGFAGTNGH